MSKLVVNYICLAWKRWRQVRRIWIPFCSIHYGRLPRGGDVLRSSSLLTTSLVRKEGQKVCPSFGRAGLWSPERKHDLFKVTQHISDRAGLKTDLTSGQMLWSPDSSNLPRRSAWRWGPMDREKWLAQYPQGVLFSELPPNKRQRWAGHPQGTKILPSSSSHSWLHTCKLISITCLVDRGCCQLCLKSRDQGVRSLGTVAFSVRDSC